MLLPSSLHAFAHTTYQHLLEQQPSIAQWSEPLKKQLLYVVGMSQFIN